MFKSFFVFLFLVVLSLQLPFSSNAEEGGTGHYLPGSAATLVDVAPSQSGWVIQPLYLYYDAEFDGTKTVPVGGLVSTGLDVRVDAITIGGVYSAETKVFGATYSAGVYVPFVWMDVTGTVENFSQNDRESGLSDVAIIPAVLVWKTGSWQYDVAFPIYAPTGDYEAGQLANLGLNYWTFDPTFGLVYGNTETGLNASLHAGITFNTENNDTDYDSGSVLHAEVSIQQLIPSKVGIFGFGLNAFLYEQISDDSGNGATNGSFRSHSIGIGPVLDYIVPTETNGTFVFELKWLPELDTHNKVEGDFIWAKAGWQF